MAKYETGAVRDTGGKGRMDLLPWSALIRISKHVENTLEIHEERNWEKGLPMHTMLDSAFRHMAKYMDGQTDEDHLAAAATNLLMALWTEEKKPKMQDIQSRLDESKRGDALPVTIVGVCGCYSNGLCVGGNASTPCSCGGDTSKCDLCQPTPVTHE